MTKWAKLASDGTSIDVLHLHRPDDLSGIVEVGDDVVADWLLVDGEFVAPPPAPPPVPIAITVRQFALEAKARGLMPQAEAVAFVSVRAIPAAIQAVLATMPAEARDEAEITVAAALEFDRHHPLTLAIADAMRGDDPLEMFADDFFRGAAAR